MFNSIIMDAIDFLIFHSWFYFSRNEKQTENSFCKPAKCIKKLQVQGFKKSTQLFNNKFDF